MKKYLVSALILAIGVSGMAIAHAAPPAGGPPGQGECDHGNSGQDCRPDPSEEGQDCEEHGNQGGVNEDHCLPTPTVTPSPTPTESPTPDPTPEETPSETPSPEPTETVTPPVCSPSVRFGPWYGDPRINVTLTGPGAFVVRGGIQRFTDSRVIRLTLGCQQSEVIGRYKVKAGHTVRVYLNGTLVASQTAPALNS